MVRTERTIPPRGGFTITELLIVIGLIVLVLALLLPAMKSVRSTGHMTESMSTMRQIAVMLRNYSTENRDSILPSQFNHHYDTFVGHPRCLPSLGEWHARGTWADILWTQYELGVFPEAGAALGNNYRYDSPDKALYDFLDYEPPNPLRAAAPNSRHMKNGDLATPYGVGALEAGLPGYFAANNFFNDDIDSPTYNGRFSLAQIKVPERSLYLVDSYAGETIEDDVAPFNNAPECDMGEVDFRYGESCLMLFLDGHVDIVERWIGLDDLRTERRIRVTDLTAR